MSSWMRLFALVGSVGLMSCTADVQETGTPSDQTAPGVANAVGKLVTLDVKGMT